MLRLLALALALSLLAGCAGVGVAPRATVVGEDARQLAEQGDHAGAARAWTREAQAARGGARDRAWLEAADQWWLAGQREPARQALGQSSRRRLDPVSAQRHDLLNAELQAAAGRRAEALALLAAPASPLPDPSRQRWHALRADLLEAAGRPFDAAGELAFLAERQDRRGRAESVRRLQGLLGGLDDARLLAQAAALPAGHPLYPYAGRLLTQRGIGLPRPYDRPVAGADGGRPAADADGYRPPRRLAVLLPLSGPLAAAGSSVRDGVLAGYYGESRARPVLRFHDTAGAGGLDAAVSAALADGADMLLGPLAREQVGSLFALPALDVPVLALNRGPVPPPPGAWTFALAPEDEGVAAADRLLARGARRVLVVHQGGDESAQRALQAFRDRLQARGGSVVAEVSVADGEPDYLPALQRAQAGASPDGLFLPLRAAPARLLSSQLDLAGLAELPRVATSLVLAGANLRMDTELEGIEYPELGWMLGLRSGLPDPDEVGRGLPSAQGGGARLFAFGLDAWRLAVMLDHLAANPDARLYGATGTLQLDGFGNVLRSPDWAVFSGGRPRPALDGALLPDAPLAD